MYNSLVRKIRRYLGFFLTPPGLGFLVLFPVLLQFFFRPFVPFSLVIFYLFFGAGLFFLRHRFRVTMRRVMLTREDAQEEINLLQAQYKQEILLAQTQGEKIIRYDRLKEIIEELNASLEKEVVARTLLETVFELIALEEGVAILYLSDETDASPMVYKKDRLGSRVVAYQMDIFDLWLMRQQRALLIEDVRNDFRFDPTKIIQKDIVSLISVPLCGRQRLWGILRLQHPRPSFFSYDDLRLLSLIAEIGSVALENAMLFEKTQDLAIHDELTGLVKRVYFLERLEEAIRKCKEGCVFSLLMLDIDHFKSYNDRYGHTAGDILLENISAAIKDWSGKNNAFACRFGGEEFCLLLYHCAKKEALFKAEALRNHLSNVKVRLRNEATSVTVSVGIATFVQDGQDKETLLACADKALYKAKRAGRNRVCGS